MFALVVTGTTHLLVVSQVPSSSLAARAIMSRVARPSTLGTRGAEPLSKKAHPWSFLLVSSWFVHGISYWFTPLPLILFLF
jgi:hypothetical protein